LDGKLEDIVSVDDPQLEAGETLDMIYAHHHDTKIPAYLLCVNVNSYDDTRLPPMDLESICCGDIVTGTFVNQQSSSKANRQIFVAVVCGLTRQDNREVVIRFQSSSDSFYEFTGGFARVQSNRLVSPFNCILTQSPKYTICGIPGLRGHLVWRAKFDDSSFTIGDVISYKKGSTNFTFICVLVGITSDAKQWKFIFAVDTAPSQEATWKDRLSIVPSRNVLSAISTRSILHFPVKDLPIRTIELSDLVIKHTRDVVGKHCDKGDIITCDIGTVVSTRYKYVTKNKDEDTTLNDGVHAILPKSNSESAKVHIHPGRYLENIQRLASTFHS
jgi:hypothetical protein